MLDTPISDYDVIENLRIVDKVARAIRLILITMVGDRRVNSTPAGTEYAINQLSRPLREMAKSYVFQKIPFPAELKPYQDGDIQINWITRTEVDVYFKIRPFEIPKELTGNIVLDLSAPAQV